MTDVNGGSAAGRGGRPPRTVAWVVVAALVAAAAGIGYAGWRHFAGPVDRRYLAVVERAATGPAALPPTDPRGRVDLAHVAPGLTPHDEAFVLRRDDGSFLVLFPTYYGSGLTLAGLMYTSRPLRGDDTHIRQTTLGRARRVITIGYYGHTDIDDRIDDHWYHVSYDLH